MFNSKENGDMAFGQAFYLHLIGKVVIENIDKNNERYRQRPSRKTNLFLLFLLCRYNTILELSLSFSATSKTNLQNQLDAYRLNRIEIYIMRI